MGQICAGYLDRHSEVEFGLHLGVSPRHLRRLFAESIGASPLQVARSRRAHFARCLLDDTDLSMTDIAYASGFGSIRRMNEVMRDVFRFSPTELRSKRRRPSYSAVDGGLRIQLQSARPIGFGQILDALAVDLVAGVEVVDEGAYRRTTLVCGHPGVVEVAADDSDLALVVTLHLPTLAGLIDEVGRCRRIARLDRSAPGKPGPWEDFEAAVKEVVRQASGPRTAEVLAALATTYGRPLDGAGRVGLTHTFPTPGSLDRLTADEVIDPLVVSRISELTDAHPCGAAVGPSSACETP